MACFPHPAFLRCPHFSGVTSITVARSRIHSSPVIGLSAMM
jgi:hypothetical protein